MPYLGCGISDFDSSELGNASVVHNTHAVIHPHLAQCPIVQLLVDGFRGRLSAKAVVSLPARIRVLRPLKYRALQQPSLVVALKMPQAGPQSTL